MNESGDLQWNCWRFISNHYHQLKMLKFIEEDLIGRCNVCNIEQDYNTRTMPNKSNNEDEEDIGEKCITLEPKKITRQKEYTNQHC